MGNVNDKAKVLLVEDNYMNRVLVTEILTLNGYDIVDVERGTEVLKAVDAERPDIILMDLQLPGMDGITAVRLLKSNDQYKDIPVYALTASAMRGDEEKILREGFDGYIAKPIEVQKLLDSLTEGLALKKGE